MNTINLSSLNYTSFKSYIGSYSIVREVSFDDKRFAYKEFNDEKYFRTMLPKIIKLSECTIDSAILPLYLVYDDIKNYKIIGYLTAYCDFLDCQAIKEKSNPIYYLNSFKNNIEKLHHNKIIHGDIHYGNLRIEKENQNTNIIDFDNCQYNKYKLRKKYASDYANLYISKYGVNEGLDIYLFNIVTFCIINKIFYHSFRSKIINNHYGLFNDTEEEKLICDSILLENSQYNKKYLIDAYQKKLNR